jgi:hypothetical protein
VDVIDPGSVKPSTDLQVHVASANTRRATELCIRSMRRYAGCEFDLTVGDVGSRDGSIEVLRRFESAGWLHLEVSPGWRRHYEWLDRWVSRCEARFGVFVDSDVEFHADGWLRDLVEAARATGAALVCASVVPLTENFIEPVTRQEMRLAPRPEMYLFLVDVPQVRELGVSFASRLDDPADVPEGALSYDVGALFFERLVGRGLAWVEMPAEYGAKYRHYGGMSWLPRRGALGRERGRHLARIGQRLFLYRTIWRNV